MSRSRTIAVLALSAAAAGLALRVIAAQNAFWLDELWSYLLVRLTAPSARQIFFNLSHDNNHILNSLFLLWMGDMQSWVWYRVPSLILGSLCIPLCFFAAKDGAADEKTRAPHIAAILCSLSFAMILYSSEARGYAGACFFGLAAYLCFRRAWTSPAPALFPLFWLLCCLGLLAQLSFVHVYVSLLAWGIYLGKKAEDRRGWARNMALLHLPVLALLAFLYFTHVRGMKVGGGPVYSAHQVMISALSVAVGGTRTGLFAYAAALAAAAAVIASLVFFRRRKDDRFVFYALVLFLAPVGVLLAAHPGRLYFRYFVVCYPFLYLALAALLGGLTAGPRGRALPGWVLLAAFVLANGATTADFLKTGRGGYPEAMRTMAQNTEGPAITVGSDDDYMGPKILLFYSRLLPRGKQLFYADKKDIPQAPPLWFIIQPHGPDEKPKAIIGLPGGSRYMLVRSYPASEFSGIPWYLYRRLPSPPGH